MPARKQTLEERQAAMRVKYAPQPAEPPQEIPAYVSAQRIAQMLDCSEDHAHRLFGSLPGAINIATSAKRACWRYPMAEALKEIQGL